MGRGANLGLASFAVAASPRTFEATIESALRVLTKSTAYQPRMRNHFCNLSRPALVSPQSMVAMITVEHPPMRLLLNGFARFEYEIAYYLSIRELHRVSLLHRSAGDDRRLIGGNDRADFSVRLDKMGNMHMLSRSVGIVAVMIFAWQSVGQAGAACQTVNGALCGGGGNGSISSVSGNVSLAQGAGILRASSGSSISPGARILAGDGGAAQVNLGAGCFASVAPNSIATFTSQNGLTCLRQSDPYHCGGPSNPQTAPAPYDCAGAGLRRQIDNQLVRWRGLLAVGVGIVACAAFCDNRRSRAPVSP